MDWLLATPQIHSTFSSLGSLEGDTYIVSANALAILEEINYKLTYEDQTLRTFRRAIGFGQNVRSDLIPLLENTKDDNILDSVIRILVNLTVPVECLFSVDVMYRTEVGRHTIFELNKLLYTSKEAFTDSKSTKSVVEYMKHILESDSKLSLQKCDQINNCLLLLRNILHIPETSANFIMPTTHVQLNGTQHVVSMQNAILWNLFIQSIDKLLLYLMTCPQRAFWGVTMVQLIALMYKDQHVSTLQKLLNIWFEASLSESSEDNESNTSPPKQGSGDSSPMLTSDPTSDSSDNGKCYYMKAPDSPTILKPALRTRMFASLNNHTCLPTGSGGCKNDSSEDRRQALREDTEATLQEVSRKGQEYQNSILCVSIEKFENLDIPDDGGATYYEEPSISLQAADAIALVGRIIKDEIMEAAHNEDSTISAATTEPMYDIKEEQTSEEINDIEQPAEHSQNTTKAALYDVDACNFMPPPALPAKASSSSQTCTITESLKDSAPKSCQKVPHSGQLNLTKGKCCPQKRECPSSQSELSDCGYGTQVENQESISTSSNDDDAPQSKPQHQKPPCNSKQRNKQRAVMNMIDKKELRRKKLVKRSKSSSINMKGMVQHTPMDDDISNLLKEFTVDFLLKGYGHLVEELHRQLLTNLKIPIDTSHFFWLVTYFLKFAAQLELDMEHISTVLTYDVISYLTYEGVTLCEQLELNSRQEGSDLKPYLRRMHLVVTAIREFLQAIETYKKVTHLSEDDRAHLQRLQIQISTTEDLRCLFVLLLRRFNPSLHTKQYLQDLVVTNHILLLILDSVTNLNDNNINIKMIEHISQFATLEVMNYYGLLLEDFNNNGEFVNDCIFTMMHHVGGDLEQIATLFQPVILKTFSRIWEADYELCDDWSDLIEYVIHKFINTPQKSTLALPTTSLTELTKEHNLENTVCIWTQEEMDTLYWYYVQSKKNNDVVGKIVKLFSNNGNTHKSRISIIQQLLQQDIITLVEYDDLMKFEDAEYQRALLTTPTSTSTESGIEIKNSSSFGKPSDDIQILRDLIVKENKEKHLIWLQQLLLECCYIKLSIKNSDEHNLDHIMEPVAYHCILKNKSIPVVQWNNEQATTMLYQPYVLLLHKLGFQLPADAGSIFARIPDFWTVEMMYNLAKKLGSLDQFTLKFNANQFEDRTASSSINCHHTTAARASLSSVSSSDIESADMEEISATTMPTTMPLLMTSGSGRILTPVQEVDIKLEKPNEIFAVPKAKHCHSIIRFTPDPTSTPSIPNWLQLVMRSKCIPTTTISIATTTTSSPLASPSSGATVISTGEQYEADICMSNKNEPSTATTLLTTANTASHHLLTTQQYAPTIATTTLAYTSSINNNTIIGLNNNEKHPQQQKQQQCNNNNNNNSTKFINENINNNNTTMTTSLLTTTTALAAATVATAAALAFKEQQKQQQQQQKQQSYKQHASDDDSGIKSFERNDSTTSSSFFTRSCSGNMDSEYSAMVAAVYENEIANSENASVASDLTRMYVSDEDERHEYRVTDFH